MSRRAQVRDATRDLVAHVYRMAENWAEMAPREGMGAAEYEAARANRTRTLWTPLHRKADRLADLLDTPPRWRRLLGRVRR